MKNLLLVFALTAFTFSFGQINKGRQMIGCNFSFSKAKSNSFDSTGTKPLVEEISTRAGFGLRYGYFIKDKIMLGVSASINTGNTHSETVHYSGYFSIGGSYSQSLHIGIFSRYYQMLGKSKFAGFAHLGVNYNEGESRTTYIYSNGNYRGNNKHSGLSVFLGAGITYFLNKNIAIETYLGSIGFTNFKTTSYSENIKASQSTSLTFTSNTIFSFSSLNIGINFYFGGKKKETETATPTP
ncbi:MAG: outer membrane beta-barrel protein [Bacteroidetes bacterium]|nr:outer membrane beta-barrel protein [Bacteroidota bacterium]